MVLMIQVKLQLKLVIINVDMDKIPNRLLNARQVLVKMVLVMSAMIGRVKKVIINNINKKASWNENMILKLIANNYDKEKYNLDELLFFFL